MPPEGGKSVCFGMAVYGLRIASLWARCEFALRRHADLVEEDQGEKRYEAEEAWKWSDDFIKL